MWSPSSLARLRDSRVDSRDFEFCLASFESGVVVVCGELYGGAEGVVVARGGYVAGQAAREVEASGELVGRGNG